MEQENKYLLVSFIEKTAKQILQEIISDPSAGNMLDIIEEEYHKTNEYPENFFDFIKSAISKNEQLLIDYLGIYDADQENMINLYDSIIYFKNPLSEEEEEEENKSDIDLQSDIIIEEDLPEYSYFNYEDIIDQPKMNDKPDDEKNLYLQLRSTINQQISNISAQLSFSKDLSYLLLKKFNWNDTQTISQLKENQELILILLKELHVPEFDIKDYLTLKVVGNGTCTLCKVNDVSLYKLYCGHCMCKKCWETEIKAQMNTNELNTYCRCHFCDAEIMISDVLSTCGEEFAKRYEKFIVQERANSDKMLIKCPSINCQHYISNEMVYSGSILSCICGKKICSKCHKDAHLPLRCENVGDFEKYIEKMIPLFDAQERYFFRELNLFYIRIANIEEVHRVNKEFIEQMEKQNTEMSQQEIDDIEKLHEECEKIKDFDVKKLVDFSINQKISDHKFKENLRCKNLQLIKQEMLVYENQLKNRHLIVYQGDGQIEWITPYVVELNTSVLAKYNRSNCTNGNITNDSNGNNTNDSNNNNTNDSNSNNTNDSNSNNTNDSNDNNTNDSNGNYNNNSKSNKCNESNDDYDDISYKISPINCIIMSEYEMWQQYNQKCQHLRIVIEIERTKGYLYLTLIRFIKQQDNEIRSKNIVSSYINALNVLINGYKAAFLMHQKSHRFDMLISLLNKLESYCVRFEKEIITITEQKLTTIIDLSLMINQIIYEIAYRFEF